MLKSLPEVAAMIHQGKLLHIAASEALLKQLPQGNWIGGSTEYFMDNAGGIVTNDQLFVDELPADDFRIKIYDSSNIAAMTGDTYDNGFSLLILPFDSEIHKYYAKNAASFENIFLKNIIGWVSGLNLAVPGQTPIAINGQDGSWSPDYAVALHVSLPEDRLVNLGIINIFQEDPQSPVFEFPEDSFTVSTCIVDGKEVILADYIATQQLNTQLPFIGDYSGVGINISIKSIENGVVQLYAPVFKGINYKLAQNIADYATEFKSQLEQFQEITAVFSCNCILNFLYGELEGKQAGSFLGPITFGEIAYQLVNQTLVYLVIS